MIKGSLLLAITATLWAQTGRQEIMSGMITLPNGIRIQYRTVLTGPSQNCCGGGTSTDKAGVVHRVVTDPRTGAYFGYDLSATPGPGNEIQVTFLPLTQGEELAQGVLRAIPAHPMPLPQYPPPTTATNGDTIAVDLMVSADGKSKLTDYLSVYKRGAEPPVNMSPARDYTIDDGPVAFRPGGVQVTINGQRYQGTAEFDVRPGSTFWLAVPGEGRYIVSLVPHDGFVQDGELRDNTIRFRNIEVRTRRAIADGAFRLYVYHDAGYRARFDEQNFVRGGVDRLENLLPR
jgi:hypothetical protein